MQVKEKEIYKAAQIDVIHFDAKDVISTSNDDIELPPINVW